MAMTKAERKASARKAAETRRKNREALDRQQNKTDDPHQVATTHSGSTADEGELHITPREEEQVWRRASDLEAPPPRAGYGQRWIRTALGGANDPKNANKKFREGWKPRPASTVPRGFNPPTITHGQFGDVIGVEDMILCEMPLKMLRQREKFYEDRTRRQTDAIERDLHKIERPGMPIRSANRTQVEQGPGRVPKVQGSSEGDAFSDDPDFQ